MDYAQTRQICLSFPGAYEDFPFGPETAVFKVRAQDSATGKVFALMWPQQDGARINLKCDPILAEQLRAANPEITPGYHMNKRHWNTVVVLPGGLREPLVHDLIEDSYDLVVSALPKMHRLLLGWTGATGTPGEITQ